MDADSTTYRLLVNNFEVNHIVVIHGLFTHYSTVNCNALIFVLFANRAFVVGSAVICCIYYLQKEAMILLLVLSWLQGLHPSIIQQSETAALLHAQGRCTPSESVACSI